MTSLLAVSILLMLNGFFVAAEFALVKARGFRIENLAAAGSATARLTLLIQANREAYLATCRLGITMASLGLGWVGEPVVSTILAPLFALMGIPDSILHTVAFLAGFLIFSALHIVVGEQVAKTLAIREPEQVSLCVAYPLRWAYLAGWPLNWILNKTARGIWLLINANDTSQANMYATAELKGLVDTAKTPGGTEYKMDSLLTNLFEFERRIVGRIMIPRHAVQMLDFADPAEHNLETVMDSGHSRLPMINSANNDEVLGVVQAKRISRAMAKGAQNPWQILQDAAQPPLLVPESLEIARLFQLMREQHKQFAIVVDEHGSMSGIVTLADLLDEIIGEVDDETESG